MDKQLLIIRHNTLHKTYRRAGLCFYQDSQPYEVTAEQLAVLRNDPRIVMHEVKTAKPAAK
jgi:hypothetical protein